mgnify:CR=1 FL=1|jgi:hypothetical protein
MERRPGTEWIRIRQRRVVDGKEYYAERLYEEKRPADAYARQMQQRGRDALALPTTHEGGHRGYAVFVRRDL